jgi:hypothetical protein
LLYIAFFKATSAGRKMADVFQALDALGESLGLGRQHITYDYCHDMSNVRQCRACRARFCAASIAALPRSAHDAAQLPY